MCVRDPKIFMINLSQFKEVISPLSVFCIFFRRWSKRSVYKKISIDLNNSELKKNSSLQNETRETY